jgi:Alpha 1,4-glycosyltransferase conserved region
MAYKQSHPNAYKVNLVPPHAFYPIGYQDITKFFTEDELPFWGEIKRHSYAVHLFGKMSSKLKIEPASLVHRAVTEYALSNGDFTYS